MKTTTIRATVLIEVQVPDDMLAEDIVEYIFPAQDVDLADVASMKIVSVADVFRNDEVACSTCAKWFAVKPGVGHMQAVYGLQCPTCFTSTRLKRSTSPMPNHTGGVSRYVVRESGAATRSQFEDSAVVHYPLDCHVRRDADLAVDGIVTLDTP